MDHEAMMVANKDEEINNDHAKILSITLLGFGSFLFGMLPAWVSRQNQQKYPLLITIFLCFGAGVLLATAIVHMLSEVKEDLPKYAEIVFCMGFFIVYIVDEIVHFCCGEAIQHTHAPIPSIDNNEQHEHEHEHDHDNGQHNHHNHGASSACASHTCLYGSDLETQSLLNKTTDTPVIMSSEIGEPNNFCDDGASNSRICHVSHTAPCEQVITGVIGLLCALSLHSFLEGLAIGVQESGSKVLLLLAAVSCHKFVVGFCLGVELRANSNSKLKNHLISILIFSMGSVLGIGLGMILVDMETSTTNDTIPVLQGLAGGTLLYVTVCEVLPREKAKWHENRECRAAGLIQLLSVATGFTVMTLLNFYLAD